MDIGNYISEDYKKMIKLPIELELYKVIGTRVINVYANIFHKLDRKSSIASIKWRIQSSKKLKLLRK